MKVIKWGYFQLRINNGLTVLLMEWSPPEESPENMTGIEFCDLIDYVNN